MKNKRTLTDKYLSCYESIRRLIEFGYLEVKLDTDRPGAFLSLACHRAFLCDKTGVFVDDKKALAFLDKVRFYMNFTRCYESGRISGNIEEAIGDGSDNTLRYPPLRPEDWTGLYVASSDGSALLLAGRWNSSTLELRPYRPAPEPEVEELEEIEEEEKPKDD